MEEANTITTTAVYLPWLTTYLSYPRYPPSDSTLDYITCP